MDDYLVLIIIISSFNLKNASPFEKERGFNFSW